MYRFPDTRCGNNICPVPSIYHSLEVLTERLLYKGISKSIAKTSTLLLCKDGRSQIIA
jgi:hypothetical protein